MDEAITLKPRGVTYLFSRDDVTEGIQHYLGGEWSVEERCVATVHAVIYSVTRLVYVVLRGSARRGETWGKTNTPPYRCN